MIAVEELTKRYGKKLAVEDLSFEVRPGVLTGFLGPNGSGKSTTMRMILGLGPSDGRPHPRLRAPVHRAHRWSAPRRRPARSRRGPGEQAHFRAPAGGGSHRR